MARSKYSRGLKIKVAKEAMLPENQGLEHVIAEKYHVMPWTVILSRLVDTFFSRISLTMQLHPKPHSTAYVLPWEEVLHWQCRSSDCSSS